MSDAIFNAGLVIVILAVALIVVEILTRLAVKKDKIKPFNPWIK